MLHEFLDANRQAVVERWRAKSASRPARETPDEGIPDILGELIEMLRFTHGSGALGAGQTPRMRRDADRNARIAAAAAQRARALLLGGFSVERVVHDYGDLGQAVAELACEHRADAAPDEFHTLNSCLDDAIAEAVAEFGSQREMQITARGEREMTERLGFLAHEQRNFLNTAILALAAIKSGAVGLNGATVAVLDRSLIGLRNLIDGALAEVRLAVEMPPVRGSIPVDRFIAELEVAASLEAARKGCSLKVACAESRLAIDSDKQLLYSAASNLLQNAFKFTRSHTEVVLSVRGSGDRVLIEVEDRCGGLPPGKEDSLFRMFEQHGADRTGLGLGLSISRRAVEACSGSLSVRDKPGVGCVFTIDVPRGNEMANAPA